MDGGCPVLFNNVKGKPNHRVVTNLFGDMQAINRMFGWESDKDRTIKLAKAINKPIKAEEIDQKDAPCQEVVIENPKDVNPYPRPDPPYRAREGDDGRLGHPLRHGPRLSAAARTSATTA